MLKCHHPQTWRFFNSDIVLLRKVGIFTRKNQAQISDFYSQPCVILKGLYIRQRVFIQAHIQVLLEINSLFEQAGIRAVVLKGLGLAYHYYPEPALRPVSDIDLLKKDDILPALDLLKQAGFHLHTPQASLTSDLLPKELNADSLGQKMDS